MNTLMDRGAITFDYGNNLRGYAHRRRDGRGRLPFSGVRPRVHPPALLSRGKGPFRWVALSGDPEDIYRTDELCLELFGRRRSALPLDQDGARAHRVPGIAEPHLLARLRRPRQVRARAQRAREKRRAQSADRDRPRPPRLRLGREPVSRNRSDEGRLRRDRRLADPERVAEHKFGARRGYRSITAAASASGTRFTREWSCW